MDVKKIIGREYFEPVSNRFMIKEIIFVVTVCTLYFFLAIYKVFEQQ